MGLFTAKGIEYYIVAEDINGTQVRNPESDNLYSITAEINYATSIDVVSGGSAENAYRMISVPLHLNQTTIFEQLKGIMPNGNSGTDWRLFHYSSEFSTYQEYPDIEGFSPGKAFWLITKNNFECQMWFNF